jgi:hypothetical protein
MYPHGDKNNDHRPNHTGRMVREVALFLTREGHFLGMVKDYEQVLRAMVFVLTDSGYNPSAIAGRDRLLIDSG